MKNKCVKLSIILVLGLIISAVNVTADEDEFGKTGFNPGITVEKFVGNDLDPRNSFEGVAEIGDVVTFLIVVENTGSTPLDIQVRDEMPVSFEYIGTMEPRNPDDFLCAFNGYTTLIWDFFQIEAGKTIKIRYQAKIVRCGELINTVEALGSNLFAERVTSITNVSDEDSVVIHVRCDQNEINNPEIKVQNYVKLDGDEQYVNEILASFDDRVIYKICVENVGNIPLFNIEVVDHLPDGTVYHSTLSDLNEPEFIDDYTLRWFFERINVGEEIIIEFETEIVDSGEFENFVEVLAYDEDDNEVLESDNAFVTVLPQQSDKYSLIVNIEGNGAVNSNPDQETYEYEDEVELTARPDEGWFFNHWSGDLSGTDNSKTIKMDSDKTITAHFIEEDTEIPEYNLTVIVDGLGIVEISPDQITYKEGTEVNLTAKGLGNSFVNWKFSHWSGALSGNNNPETIKMDSDKTITAHFIEEEKTKTTGGNGGESEEETEENTEEESEEQTEENTEQESEGYILIIERVGNGSVTKNPEKQSYKPGEIVELTAIADTGWEFEKWTGDINTETNPITIIMDSNKTVRATFIEKNETESDGFITENPPTNTEAPASSFDPIDDHESNPKRNHNNGFEIMDFSLYLIIGGIILLLLVLSIFFLKDDKHEEETFDEQYNPINDDTMCYPNTPRTVNKLVNHKEFEGNSQ